MARHHRRHRERESGICGARRIRHPGVTAKVTALSDTGQLSNFDPVVNLSVTLEDGTAVEMQTLVSKLQIPRVGDSISLIPNPAQPGT